MLPRKRGSACVTGSVSTCRTSGGLVRQPSRRSRRPDSNGSRSPRRRSRCSPTPVTSLRHGRPLRRSLEVTRLGVVVHGPTNLRLGSSLHNRAGEGLVEYAHELGATHVVYHALDLRKPGPETEAEERSLQAARALGRDARRHSLPREPLPGLSGRLQHLPRSAGGLRARRASGVAGREDAARRRPRARRRRSGRLRPDRLRLAGARRVGLFHIHDNLGARRRETGGPALDPLRLDLHLAPGGGTLPWGSLAKALTSHSAPLVLEIHPSHRPSASALREATEAALLGGPAPSAASLESLRSS